MSGIDGVNRDLLLLAEMVAAAERASALVEGISLEGLAADPMRRDALLWNLTVLGEASVQVSDETKERFDSVAWRRPARLRNRLVHGYWAIDLGVVHATAEQQLPAFAAELRDVLHALESDAGPCGTEGPTGRLRLYAPLSGEWFPAPPAAD